MAFNFRHFTRSYVVSAITTNFAVFNAHYDTLTFTDILLACAKNVRVIVPVATTAFTGCMPKTSVYMSIVLVVVMLASDNVREVEPAVSVPVT